MDYATLAEAFTAAQEGETITVLKDLDVNEMIPVTKSVTLDLNGKTITSQIPQNRLFRLSGVTFTIDGKNGKFIIPGTYLSSYGFVDFRDASNAASADAKLIASDVSFEGGTKDGSLFAFRTSGQAIDFDNVNVNLTGGYAYSIINGYKCSVDINIKGGEYICNSTHQTAGVFQAYDGSNINFNGVKVPTVRDSRSTAEPTRQTILSIYIIPAARSMSRAASSTETLLPSRWTIKKLHTINQ